METIKQIRELFTNLCCRKFYCPHHNTQLKAVSEKKHIYKCSLCDYRINKYGTEIFLLMSD